MQKSNLFTWTCLALIIILSIIVFSGCSNFAENTLKEDITSTGNLLIEVNLSEEFIQSKTETKKAVSLKKVKVEIVDNRGNIISKEAIINNNLIKFSFAELQTGTVWTVNIICENDSGEIVYREKAGMVTIEKNKDKLISLYIEDDDFSVKEDIIQEVFSAEQDKEISLDYLGTDQYAIIGISPLSFKPDGSYFYDGSINVNGHKKINTINNQIISDKKNNDKSIIKNIHNKQQTQLDSFLRRQENEFEVENNIEEIKARLNSLQIDQNYSLGDEKQFYVFDFSSGNYNKITATLEKVSDRAYLFVDQDEDISLSTLNQYASEFDNRIFPTNMEYFATHQYESSHYDYDNNGKSIILFTLLDNFPEDGLIMGFFNSVDFSTAFTYSNKGDMFYLNSYAVKNNMDSDVLSTIAHEFQHLLFFVEKRLYNERSGDDTWINEGFSGLAEYLNGYYNYTGDRRIYAGNGGAGFFDKPEVESLLSWEGKLSDYGASNTFVLYLYNRLGPSRAKDMIKDVISGDRDPVEIISDNYIDFTDLYLDWITANRIYDKDVAREFTYPVNLEGKPQTDILNSEDSFSIKEDAQKYYYIEGGDKAVDISINLPDIRTGVIIYIGDK